MPNLLACPGCYPTSIILGGDARAERGLVKADRHHRDQPERRQRRGPQGRGGILVSPNATNGPRLRHPEASAPQRNRAGAFLLAERTISFAPHLIPLNRGIISTIYLDLARKPADALADYRDFYRGEHFVRVTDSLPDTKNVELTNFCDISVRVDSAHEQTDRRQRD